MKGASVEVNSAFEVEIWAVEVSHAPEDFGELGDVRWKK